MGSRVWLLLPAAVLYTFDICFTLLGQSSTYWNGDYEEAIEVNPIAYPILATNPYLFLVLGIVWLIIFSVVVLKWRHPISTWGAIFLAIGHAVGGATWVTEFGAWGTGFTIAYVILAAQFATSCWRRYANLSPR